MSTNSTTCIACRTADGTVRWAVVFVEDTSYSVYYPNGLNDVSWTKEGCDALYHNTWRMVMEFIENARNNHNPAIQVVRPCVVRKFLRERKA